MGYQLNVNSEENFDGIGDLIPLNEFIGQCEDGILKDGDGFASELVLADKVILNFHDATGRWLYPSDVRTYKEALLEGFRQAGNMFVAWCEKETKSV